jgi:hypothetical protein
MSGMNADPAGGSSRARAMSPAQAGYVQGSIADILETKDWGLMQGSTPGLRPCR